MFLQLLHKDFCCLLARYINKSIFYPIRIYFIAYLLASLLVFSFCFLFAWLLSCSFTYLFSRCLACFLGYLLPCLLACLLTCLTAYLLTCLQASLLVRLGVVGVSSLYILDPLYCPCLGGCLRKPVQD